MELSNPEREALVDALLKTYPSRAALVETVRYQFGEDLDVIAGYGDLKNTVFELVIWAEQQGRTAELIRASQQWNPQNSAMSEFMGSVSRATRQDAQTIPASAPKLSVPLRRALVDALLLVPGIDNFEVRSQLLIGIPWRATLTRGWSDVRADLETMVDELGSLGQLNSGAWPLLILADNARAYAEGTEAEMQLDKVYKRLLAFYEGKKDRTVER
jgi:hypothetical protein